jgi:hypothetical protein
VDEIGYQLMNLGINSQDLQEFVMTRIDLVKDMGSRLGKSKTGGETPVRTKLGETTGLIPLVLHVCCFHPDFQLYPQFHQNWGLVVTETKTGA